MAVFREEALDIDGVIKNDLLDNLAKSSNSFVGASVLCESVEHKCRGCHYLVLEVDLELIGFAVHSHSTERLSNLNSITMGPVVVLGSFMANTAESDLRLRVSQNLCE